MNKEELLNSLLAILPASIENIMHIEKVGDKLILSDNVNKFTIKIFTKKLQNNSNGCSTFLYKSENGDLVYKPKVKYASDKEAIAAAMKVNIKDQTIHKYIAYKCKNCNNWHIGKGYTTLSKFDKIKLKQKHNL